MCLDTLSALTKVAGKGAYSAERSAVYSAGLKAALMDILWVDQTDILMVADLVVYLVVLMDETTVETKDMNWAGLKVVLMDAIQVDQMDGHSAAH